MAALESQRIPALDGLRGLACLLVVSFHYVADLAVVPVGSFLSRAQRIAQGGWTGVDLFFVLSGFLIAGILMDKRESSSYFSTFYIRRACRIFPLYFLLVLSYAAIRTVGVPEEWGKGLFTDPDPLPAWPYFLFLQNNFIAVAGSFGAGYLGVTWSLALEEQFYFILPALVRRFGTRANVAKMAGLFILIGPLSRAVATYGFGVRGWIFSYALLPTRCEALGAGMLIAVLYRSGDLWEKVKNASLPAAGLAAGAIIVPTGVLFGLAQERRFIFNYTFIAAFYALLLVAALIPNTPFSKVMTFRPIRAMGNLSYSTYLIHPILLQTAFTIFRHAEPQLKNLQDLELVALSLVATLALSWTSWTFLERPIISWGHRFAYK